jgi:hypothetical protein
MKRGTSSYSSITHKEPSQMMKPTLNVRSFSCGNTSMLQLREFSMLSIESTQEDLLNSLRIF